MCTVESPAMSNHPNRGWRGRWVVDLAAGEARHGPSGLVVRFPGAQAVNAEEVRQALQERHGAAAVPAFTKLMVQAAQIYQERTHDH